MWVLASPGGSSADSLALVPGRRNQEQPAPFPATQHPTFPVVAHTELLLTGEPPLPSTPSLRGKWRPPHPLRLCPQLPLAPRLPHPPGEVGPPSRGFRPPGSFHPGPTVG